MSLFQTIQQDLIQALKAQDRLKTDTLRLVKAALTNYQIEKKKDHLTDSECVEILQRLVKQRTDSVTSYESAGRTELAEKEKREIEILRTYLPKPLTEEELRQVVLEAIRVTGATSRADLGKVMKAVMPKVKGKADGRAVQELVAQLLG